MYHLSFNHSTYDLQVKSEERYAWKCKAYECTCLNHKVLHEWKDIKQNKHHSITSPFNYPTCKNEGQEKLALVKM